MVFKVYKRIGIRRNNNLSDISSPVESLDNILDSLAPIGGETFVSSDLDAIRNLFSQGLDNDEYKGIVNSAVEFTTPNGSNTEFDPRITYQNRLDKFTAFAGEPRFNGGNGLTANYYQNDQINFDTDSDFNYGVGISDFENTTSGQIFTGITTEGAIISDNFWEQGNFEYTGKIHPQSVKSNVGVKWEGFYIPSVTGNLNLNVSSTGYFTADFEKDGGASEALVLRVAKPMSGLGVARAGGVQEPLHSKGLPCVRGSNRWVYVRADVQAETRHLFEEALDNLDL